MFTGELWGQVGDFKQPWLLITIQDSLQAINKYSHNYYNYSIVLVSADFILLLVDLTKNNYRTERKLKREYVKNWVLVKRDESPVEEQTKQDQNLSQNHIKVFPVKWK